MIKWFRKIYSAALAGHEARLRLIAEKKYGGVNAKISASIDYKAIANTLLDEGRFFEAEIQYRNAIRQNKDEPNFYVMLGYVLKEQGKNNEAVEQLTIALQLAPNDFDAHYMLASIAHTDGHFEEAMRRYEDVLTLNPKFEFAYREYSFLLSQRGELQKAHSVIDRAMVNFPDGADYHLIKGNLFLNQKKIRFSH